MRAFAVLMMIQGHSIDALLSQTYLNSESIPFKIWDFGRGLTAPIFLFGSGFAYALATVRKSFSKGMDSQNGRMPLSLFFKRLRWIGLLFILGALMHFPEPTLAEMMSMPRSSWTLLFQVDILRMMAISLFLLLLVFLLAKSLKSILISTVAIGSFIVLITPLIYDVNWLAIFPEPIAAFFSMKTGSFFPIFPFAAYLFAGSAAGALYLQWQRSEKTDLFSKYYLIGGIVIIAAGLVLDALPIQIYPTYNYWKTSPNLFLFRAGCVLILWSGVNYAIKKVRRLPEIIPITGQHTLPIYVAHIVVLYGCAWWTGLNFHLGKVLDPLQTAGIIIGLIGGSLLFAYILHHTKTYSYLLYRGIQTLSTASMILFMFVW